MIPRYMYFTVGAVVSVMTLAPVALISWWIVRRQTKNTKSTETETPPNAESQSP